jgi:four helix bundle protein
MRRFVHTEIALREAREAAYWLRICVVLQVGPGEELKNLTGEASQICRILGAIVVKTKYRARAGLAVFEFCILNFALLFS